ncbi:MAG: GAF domain-containing protein [Prochloraceae cyanobacterium]|nr:GAF domain-containing protein [Prochloraceae cyanobacterium]
MQSSIISQLESLNEVTTNLVQCQSLAKVVKKALEEVRKRLKVQVASIFLLSKEGVIERIGIDGVDRDNNPIDDRWLSNEHYQPGESFSGFPVPKADSKSDYGKPNYVNNFTEQYPRMKYEKEYLEKLGKLQCGISVPLNGLSRTFGTLEVLNKQEKNSFTSEDLYWLMLIGSNLAEIISSFISKEYNKNFKSLIDILVDLEPSSKNFNLNDFYENIANKVISKFTPYKVCIIRIPDQNEALNIKARVCTKDISLEERIDSSIPKKSYIIGKVYDTKEAQFIDNIQLQIDRFFNKDWIQAQGLKSFACLPLKIKNNCVGTISIYSKYRMKFSKNDRDILKYLAFLIAAITERVRIIDELKRVRKELSDAQEKFLNMAILVGYETQLENFIHQYKNELIETSLVLRDLLTNKKSLKEKNILINDKLDWLENRTKELKSLIRVDEPISVQINDLIKEVIETFPFDNSIEFKETYNDLPVIYVNKNKITCVIHNLISNAIVAINRTQKKKGKILITTNVVIVKDIQKIQLVFEDNGIGISNEIRDEIYKQGFTTRKNQGGTGMGLYIAKMIIEDYGGRIYFNSKVGQGTKFYVEIPIKRHQK